MPESALASLKRTYWTSNGAGRKYFTKQTLVNAISFLKNTSFVTLLVIWFLNKVLVYQLVLTQS